MDVRKTCKFEVQNDQMTLRMANRFDESSDSCRIGTSGVVCDTMSCVKTYDKLFGRLS